MTRDIKKEKGIHSYRLADNSLRWKFVVYTVRDGKSRAFWFKGFTTKTAALKRRKDILKAKETQGRAFRPEDYQRRQSTRTHQAPNVQLFDTILDKWLETKQAAYEKGALSKSQLYACTRSAADFFRPLYQGKPFSVVTRASWVECLDNMKANGHSYYIRKQATSCLSSLMTYAADRGVIPVNPLMKMSKVLGAVPASNRYPMTEKERCKFLEAAQHYRDGKHFALLHGMLEGPRPGEQLALEIAGLYPDHKAVLLQWNYTDGILKPLPKNKRIRYMELSEETTRLYMIQAERAAAEQIAAGLPARWLFPNLNPTREIKLYNNRELRAFFYAVCRRAGIRRVVPYEGRTTAACTIFHKGGPIEAVSDHLGHSSTDPSWIYTEKSLLLGPPPLQPGPRPVDLLNLPLPRPPVTLSLCKPPTSTTQDHPTSTPAQPADKPAA